MEGVNYAKLNFTEEYITLLQNHRIRCFFGSTKSSSCPTTNLSGAVTVRESCENTYCEILWNTLCSAFQETMKPYSCSQGAVLTKNVGHHLDHVHKHSPKVTRKLKDIPELRSRRCASSSDNRLNADCVWLSEEPNH